MKRAMILLVAVVSLSIAGFAAGESRDAPKPTSAVQPAGEWADKPLYQMTPAQVGRYIGRVHQTIPDLRQRIAHLARKNLGQPYDIYLLGESPFETIDPQPIYCLEKSDCVTFSEHTLAMALSDDWPSFLTMLQRIRYADGKIGVRTRNHYTEADWNPNNAWLFREVSAELAGEQVRTYTQEVDRARFFRERYHLNVDVPVQVLEVDYVPLSAVPEVAPKLRTGDMINFFRGRANANGELENLYVGHVGLIVHGEDGQVHVIHSATPRVREQPLREIVESAMNQSPPDEGDIRLAGFKFLRLREKPLVNLRKLDGPDAPDVTLPDGRSFDPAVLSRPSTRPAETP